MLIIIKLNEKSFYENYYKKLFDAEKLKNELAKYEIFADIIKSKKILLENSSIAIEENAFYLILKNTQIFCYTTSDYLEIIHLLKKCKFQIEGVNRCQ